MKSVFTRFAALLASALLPVLATAGPAATPVLKAAAESASIVTPAAEVETALFVLCYHRFVKKPEAQKEEMLAGYQLPVEEFKWQMQYLKDKGFTPVSLQQLSDHWFQGKPLPLKPVLICFDDGFRTIYRHAFPVLKELGYPSVLFLYTQFIEYEEIAGKNRAEGKTKSKAVPLGKQALRVSDILDMQENGVEVAVHTKDHLPLAKEGAKLTVSQREKMLEQQLSQPITFIESRYGHKPTALSYPYGDYNQAVMKKTREKGYRLAFTVNPGPNDRTVPALKLKRNLILYPIRREAFKKIFKDKVLHLGKTTPADGDVVYTREPLVSVEIKDDVVPGSIEFKRGSKNMKFQYDGNTRVLTHRVKTPLRKGGHMLTVSAKDKNGQSRVYTWYFRVQPKETHNTQTRNTKKANTKALSLEERQDSGNDKTKEPQKELAADGATPPRR